MLSIACRALSVSRSASGGQLARFVCPPLGELRRAVSSSTANIPEPLPDALPTEPWHSHGAERSSYVQKIRSERELSDLLASGDADTLFVVKFHATLCTGSKAIEPKYEETAAEFSDTTGSSKIQFAEVNFDKSQQLCHKLGILSLPHVQIFAGGKGKIADFSIAPSKYDTLSSLLRERREAANGQDKTF